MKCYTFSVNIWGISSAGRALHWQCRGQRFDPAMLHQRKKHLRKQVLFSMKFALRRVKYLRYEIHFVCEICSRIWFSRRILFHFLLQQKISQSVRIISHCVAIFHLMIYSYKFSIPFISDKIIYQTVIKVTLPVVEQHLKSN